VQLRPAGRIALLSTGAILGEVSAAADLLAEDGMAAGIRSFPWLDPLDVEAIRDEAGRAELLVTVEEHSIVGGLGSAVAEVLAELRGAPPLLRIALPPHYSSVVGDQQYLRRVYGLDAEAIARRVHTYLEEAHGLAG
jgi:transketolase